MLLAIAIFGILLWLGCNAIRDHLKTKREFRSQVIQGIQDINESLKYTSTLDPVELEDKFKHMEAIDAKLMTRRVDKQAVDNLLKEMEDQK